MSLRINTAIQRFDQLNAEDPNKLIDSGKEVSVTLYMAKRLTHWVKELNPMASDTLILASRCQHICRWKKPRSSYPEGRTAYLKWRKDLQKYHAKIAGEILEEMNFDASLISDLKSLLMKENRDTKPEMQTLEDALCLVFLEKQFSGFVEKHTDEKLIKIVQKTWSKMSDQAHELALGLSYSENEKKLLELALN